MSSDCWTANTHKHIAQYSGNMLWRFVRPNAAESETEQALLNLTGLRRADIALLASIRFLLSDYTRFLINEIAPKIISRLAKESINERVTDRNRVCGRIDWQQTIRTRATAGNDQSIFVYTRRAQIYDLPENRLFLFLLQQTNRLAQRFASPEEIEATKFSEENIKQRWVEKIARISYMSSRLMKNPFISKISRLHEISDRTIEAVSRNRQAHYRQLAFIATEFAISTQQPVKYLKRELHENILEPLNSNTLYEIAVLFNVLHTAISMGWEEIATGLIGGTGKTASILSKGARKLKVYTQKLPEEMKENSSYGFIMESYGLSERLRRPDIILEFINGNKKHFLIIEVKRSQRRAYLADGSYKLLGYLKDFEGVVTDKTKLSGFLVGWDRIEYKALFSIPELHMTTWGKLSVSLSSFFNLYENS